jgi:hypothetical protein
MECEVEPSPFGACINDPPLLSSGGSHADPSLAIAEIVR